MKTLADLKVGESGVIKKIDNTDPALKRSIVSNGFIKGSDVMVSSAAPLGDPIVVKVRSMTMSMRREEAKAVILED